MLRSNLRASLVALMFLVATPASLVAASAPRAELAGRPLPLHQVANYHCHDFEYPIIRCFTSSAALESDVTSVLASTRAVSAQAVTYVRVWDLTWYAGYSMFISQNYGNLGSIGWNDRISSYVAQNGESGEFFTNAYGGGAIDSFCCSQSAPTLSSTFNNAFSSVYRT